MSTQDSWYRRTHDGIHRKRVDSKIGRNVRTYRRCFCAALGTAVLIAAPAFAKNHYHRENPNGNQIIVRAAPADIGPIAAQYGLEVAGELESAGEYAALLQAPPSLTARQVEDLLRDDARVQDVTPATLAALPESVTAQLAMGDLMGDMTKPGDFTTPCLSQGFPGLLWRGYAEQDAFAAIGLHEAHLANGDCGSATVAVIDTGVDPDHPLIRGALVDGYDFLAEAPGIPSEWANLDLSIAAIVELSIAAIVEQSQQASLLGQGEARLALSIAAIVEQAEEPLSDREPEIPGYFGHGTMVAGLIRIAAPAARIMPLRVFDGTGRGHVFDIVRAIHHAVDHGADIINMSFSVESSSKELKRAIQYARKNGVICVGAAGNQGQQTMIYPAAHADVISVAALQREELATYSNFGSNLVDVAAPGYGVISAFPGGLYGAGWGTSFSAPLVSGTMALLIHRYPQRDTAAIQSMESALRQGSERIDSLNNLIGSGRIDMLGTVMEAQN